MNESENLNEPQTRLKRWQLELAGGGLIAVLSWCCGLIQGIDRGVELGTAAGL
jgi:hypothetical protein